MATFSSIRRGKILGRNTIDRPVLRPANNIFDTSIRPIIAAKPQLIPAAQYNALKPIINIVDVNPLQGLVTDSNKSFSPRLVNWVEPYVIGGVRKTLFYTEVNSGLSVGDRVFIIGGNYDSNQLIEEDKYKKGRDGYKVIFVDRCRVVLDIDFTGTSPYKNEDPDTLINVQYISNESEFINVNREFTTKGGTFSYKYSFDKSNIIFSDVDFTNPFLQSGFGANPGLTGSPGFYVRDDEDFLGNGRYIWINITSNILSGSFSYVTVNPDINRIKIVGKTFTIGGQEFKEGYIYKFSVGPTQSIWIPDVSYLQPVITKGNFRDGNFKGDFNTGLFGSLDKKIKWNQPGATFKSGSIVNTSWEGGLIESLFSLPESFTTEFDSIGTPYQKSTGLNNNGRGYNFIFDSEILTSTIKNASVYSVEFGTQSNIYSIVENHILATSSVFSNNVERGYFENCKFYNSSVKNSELKKSKLTNTHLDGVKSINSNFTDSLFLNSNYINDLVIKISGYDEFLISEKRNLSSTFSSVNEASHKVYKFYVDFESWKRLKFANSFYFKGLKINDGSGELINFFDKKFKLTSWTEYDDFFYSSQDTDILNIPTIGNTTNQISLDTFYKRGQQISCFLSTPEDNSHQFTSVYTNPSSGYYTKALGANPKKSYSVDIVVDIRDTFGNYIRGLDFNYNSVSTPNSSLTASSAFLGNIVDISNAFIVESSFDSGLFERSNWTTGDHINPQFDSNITSYSPQGGAYNLSVITASSILIATASTMINYNEDQNLVNSVGNVVFLNSVYYDTSGRVESISISQPGTGYTSSSLITIPQTGTGVGLQISITESGGNIISADIVSQGKKYLIGDTFIVPGGNNDAQITIVSVTGSVTKLPDSWKVIQNTNNGEYQLQQVSNNPIDLGPYSDGDFYTINNRWSYLHKTKFKTSKIKSGVFRRTYFNESFIEDSNYDTTDIDFTNYNRVKNLLISDSIFVDNSNLLSKATYYRSHFSPGSDTWNNGVIYQSVWNGGTFSKGVFKDSNWEAGTFQSGKFYLSRSFNANPSINSPTYDSNNKYDYYKSGLTTATTSNNRHSWKSGKFIEGEFIKSDWEGGLFENGKFYNSKWYSGTFSNGFIGIITVPQNETMFYNGEIQFATVDSAEITAKDTSLLGLSQSNILWKNGVFNSGVFSSDTSQSPNHTATWETGIFNNGEFKTNAVWKNGTFNGGKFLSSYLWQTSSLDINNLSNTQTDYAWQDGVFNGGEFGDASYGTNSTWYKGQFNGGKFKGRVWNNGILTAGELQGGSTWSAVGGYDVDGMTESNANSFVNSFVQDFYGLWRGGIVSQVVDDFITDVKVFDKLKSVKELSRPTPTTVVKNTLWLSGTFSHANAIMENSVWLDGIFRKGRFLKSSFNPFVLRPGSASQSFNLNDDLVTGSGSCVWTSGIFDNSDFYISQWKSGTFISGTAFGMVWKNGVANYMNAYNVFWEDGTWRNGNWYGSYFQFDGTLDSPFNRQILFRGMNYTGTSSLHIWNVFTENSTNSNILVSATASTPASSVLVQQAPGGPSVFGGILGP